MSSSAAAAAAAVASYNSIVSLEDGSRIEVDELQHDLRYGYDDNIRGEGREDIIQDDDDLALKSDKSNSSKQKHQHHHQHQHQQHQKSRKSKLTASDSSSLLDQSSLEPTRQNNNSNSLESSPQKRQRNG